jgi:choline kinase
MSQLETGTRELIVPHVHPKPESRQTTNGCMALPVVLAAGLGRRLGGVPKALYPLAGVPLIARCANALAKIGFAEMLIVTGHGRTDVERYWLNHGHSLVARFVHNPRFAELNNFFTLAVAIKAAPPGPLLVLNSDIVFSAEIPRHALRTVADLVLAVEPGSVDSEAMKVVVDGQQVRRVSKHASPTESLGEFVGVSLLSDRGRASYLTVAEHAVRSGLTDFYYEDVYQQLCNDLNAAVSLVDSRSWAEIDSPDDVPNARQVAARLADDL